MSTEPSSPFAGNLAVARSYLVKLSSDAYSTTISLALVGGVQGVGFVLGPGLASLFDFIDATAGPFRFNDKTMPAYFGAALAALMIVFLHVVGLDSRSAHEADGGKQKQASGYQPLLDTVGGDDDGDSLHTGTSSSDAGVASDAAQQVHVPTDVVITDKDRLVVRPAGQDLIDGDSDVDPSKPHHDHRYPQVSRTKASSSSHVPAQYQQQQQQHKLAVDATSSQSSQIFASHTRRRHRAIGSLLCFACVFGVSLVFTVRCT